MLKKQSQNPAHLQPTPSWLKGNRFLFLRASSLCACGDSSMVNPTYTHEEQKQRAFLRTAMVIRSMWEEKGSSDTRLLQEPLIRDSLVTVGESLRGKGRREHIVPRAVLCGMAHQMLADGASDAEVAAMLMKYLKIVHIHPDEQALLDSSKHFNLRQCMPEGWSASDGCEFGRLKAAGIEYKLYE